MFELQPVYYWFFVLAAVVCYFIGSFNFAVLLSHIKNKDIRSQGSGNPGTMNMTRTFGVKFGLINFFCDAIKGGLPALAGWLIFKDYVFYGTNIAVADFARYFFGTFVIVGHIFPFYMKFKGGKGIASTMGMFIFSLPCEKWWYFFIAFAFIFCIVWYVIFFELGSLGSLIGVSGLSIWQGALFALRYSNDLLNGWVVAMFMLLLAINLMTWIAHRKNIYMLLAGEEHRTKVGKRKNKIKP